MLYMWFILAVWLWALSIVFVLWILRINKLWRTLSEEIFSGVHEIYGELHKIGDYLDKANNDIKVVNKRLNMLYKTERM